MWILIKKLFNITNAYQQRSLVCIILHLLSFSTDYAAGSTKSDYLKLKNSLNENTVPGDCEEAEFYFLIATEKTYYYCYSTGRPAFLN